MLQAQMKMSSVMKDENKRLLLKLEEKKENHRYSILNHRTYTETIELPKSPLGLIV